MARPNLPAQLHEIKGDYNKNPQRRPQNTPKPKSGIGPAPEITPNDWKECWDEIVNHVCLGVLGDSDRIWLERAAKLLAQSRTPEAKWTGAEEKSLQVYLSRFGMNPADRSKISIGQPGDEDDPAAKYF